MKRWEGQGRYYLYALVTVILWSTAAPAVKSLTEGMSSLCVLGWSSLSASGFLLLLLFLRGQAGTLRRYGLRDYGVLVLLGFTGMFLYSSLYYFGIDRLSAQEACILNYLWPVMIVLFSCLILKEPFTGRKGAAITLSFSGVLVIALWELSVSGGFSGDWPGIAACLLAAVCYGLFCVLNKRLDPDQTVGMAVFWAVACLGAFLLCALRGELRLPTPPQAAGMLWLGVAVHGAPYLLWAVALNGVSNTARIANLAYLTPILSVLLSSLALGERLSPAYLAALILILAGILIQNLGVRSERTS